MTCIIAIETSTAVHLGADRQSSLNGNGYTRSTPKIFHVGELIIGACGPVRIGQLLATMDPPFHSLGWDIDRWIALDLVDAARTHFATHHYDRTVETRSWIDGAWIVAVRGRAYTIYSDWSWSRHKDGIHVIGSGTDIALGALHAADNLGAVDFTAGRLDPQQRITLALSAAAAHDTGVGGPFDHLTQPRPQEA